MGDPQAYGQVEEMLARPDIDAVYIATPHNHHFPDGMQALKAGKHVLIEKPFALNLGEGRELQAEAARQEKLALEAMWCDYAPKYDVIRQLLEDGRSATCIPCWPITASISPATTASSMPILPAGR